MQTKWHFWKGQDFFHNFIHLKETQTFAFRSINLFILEAMSDVSQRTPRIVFLNRLHLIFKKDPLKRHIL